MDPLVLGLTGSFGSGCSFVAARYLNELGFRTISLSDLLKDSFAKEHTDRAKDPNRLRAWLQDHGNELRQSHGAGHLAEQALGIMQSRPEVKRWCVDSIRNPGEVEKLRTGVVGRFYLMAVFADADVRWARVRASNYYKHNQSTFDEDDRRDSGEDEGPAGQRVRDCYKEADIIVSSNEDCTILRSRKDNFLRQKIQKYVGYLDGQTFVPSSDETMMVAAYAASLRSRCMKRQVGAVLVNRLGVISMGYNEVPDGLEPCSGEYARCYREICRERYSNAVSEIVEDEEQRKALAVLSRREFKALDYCRALHAEESAILAAGYGLRPLENTTLYATTYPCNLCANKAVHVGIKRVVYLEPYPMKEAKEILARAGVIQEPFEGVTYNGYFRLTGGVTD